eukprot:6172127-Pleurochrysis_carterae.AAC.3
MAHEAPAEKRPPRLPLRRHASMRGCRVRRRQQPAYKATLIHIDHEDNGPERELSEIVSTDAHVQIKSGNVHATTHSDPMQICNRECYKHVSYQKTGHLHGKCASSRLSEIRMQNPDSRDLGGSRCPYLPYAQHMAK